MNLEIIHCIECASSMKGDIPNFETKKDDFLEISMKQEKCAKCGKDIRIRGIKLKMKRRFWGGMEFIFRWY